MYGNLNYEKYNKFCTRVVSIGEGAAIRVKNLMANATGVTFVMDTVAGNFLESPLRESSVFLPVNTCYRDLRDLRGSSSRGPLLKMWKRRGTAGWERPENAKVSALAEKEGW